MNPKALARRLVPRKLYTAASRWKHRRAFRALLRADSARLLSQSGAAQLVRTRPTRQFQLYVCYHVIEKGLSLRSPRPGFGEQAVKAVMEQVRDYRRDFGCDATVHSAVNALRAYHQFNAAHQVPVPHVAQFLTELDALEHCSGAAPDAAADLAGGAFECDRDAIAAAIPPGIEAFFQRRHSIRNFADRPVGRAEIEAALRLASRSPSACNRQPWRVYALTGKPIVAQALALQNGNRGFNDSIHCVLVVASSLGAALHPPERHQPWIDGGMFSMALVYALHAQRLGTCCLNWCASPESDRALRTLLQVPEDQVVIMMIAVGHLPQTFRVAHSHRNAPDEFTRWFS